MKHLEFIQGVVNRLSMNSFLLKGWTVALISALFALAAKDTKPQFAALAYFPCFMFWTLDGYFLWQERLFRKLYDQVRSTNPPTDFGMSTKIHAAKIGWVEAIFSKTLIMFHGTIAAVILVVMATVKYGW